VLFLGDEEPWLSFSTSGKTARARLAPQPAVQLRAELSRACIERRVLRVSGHELSVSASSNPGSFICGAPAVAEPHAEPARNAPVREILVIEDDALFRKVLERFVVRQGIQCRAVESPLDALTMLEGGYKPLAVAVDLHMPEVNGLQFVRAFRAVAEYDSIPLLVLTSDCDIEARITCYAAGVDGYFLKNDDPRVLCARVQALAARRFGKERAP
jgi:CheY-like chemotaxis protein